MSRNPRRSHPVRPAREARASVLTGIDNFRPLTPLLATAGQPDADQLHAVCLSGYRVVINLGLANAAYALPEEAAIVLQHGLRYHHLPVSFEAPEKERFVDFRECYREVSDQKCFIHCAANKRVSSFVALYRILELNWPRAQAESEMRAVWEPDPIWRAFIDRVLATADP